MSAWIGPAIVAALIGCLTTMLGWSVSFRQLRKLETTRRNEKIIDYQTALRAEIRSYRHASSIWTLMLIAIRS